MTHTVLIWLDLIWLPMAALVAHPKQRLWAIGAILMCMVMMRMLIELMDSIGHSSGILGLLSTPLYLRGLATYSFFYAAYLIFAYLSPGRDGWLFMAASLSLLMLSTLAFCAVAVL